MATDLYDVVCVLGMVCAAGVLGYTVCDAAWHLWQCWRGR